MKNVLALLLSLTLLIGVSACNRSSKEETQEEKEVDAMIQTDEQRADSMKKALGLE